MKRLAMIVLTVACAGKSASTTSPDAADGAASAGDSEPPASQAVLWFVVTPPENGICPTMPDIELPDDARDTITSVMGTGNRIVDGGEHIVACRVERDAQDATRFELDLYAASGPVGLFSITGIVNSNSNATVGVSVTTASAALEQMNCTAALQVVVPGAVWLQSLSCPTLRDPAAPGVQCAGIGGVIFENCDGQ